MSYVFLKDVASLMCGKLLLIQYMPFQCKHDVIDTVQYLFWSTMLVSKYDGSSYNYIYIYYIFVTFLYDGCCFMGMASLDNLVKCESSSVAPPGPCESRTEPHLL